MSSKSSSNKKDKEVCYSQANVTLAEPVIVTQSQIDAGKYTSAGVPQRCRLSSYPGNFIIP